MNPWKFFGRLTLSCGLFITTCSALFGDQPTGSLETRLVIKSLTITNESRIVIPDTEILKNGLIEILTDAGYSFVEQPSSNVNIDLSARIWSGSNGVIFCQIKETLSTKLNILRSNLEIISALPSNEEFLSYFKRAIPLMVRDLLAMNLYIKKNELVVNKSQPETKNTDKFKDKPTEPVRVILDKGVFQDFSQIKVKYQPPGPNYPPAAKMQKIQAIIILILTINTDGTPIVSSIIKGHPALNETALAYSLRWQFEPAKIDNNPVITKFILTMPFTLR